MMMIARILGAVVGGATALNVLLGYMSVPEFFAADLILGAILIISAVLPAGLWARRGLLTGNAYALGVYTVALARQLAPGGHVNPGLVAAMAGAGLGLLLLLTMKEPQ